MKYITIQYLFVFTLINFYANNAICQPIHAAISYGELIDKITILTIKTERISNPEKLRNITQELKLLLEIFNKNIPNQKEIIELMTELKITNEKLWDIEDLLRAKERIKEFGNEFIELARNVYITNDHRCFLKRKIDTLLGSQILEEKSYESYS